MLGIDIDRLLMKSSFQYYIIPSLYCLTFSIDNYWLFIFIVYGIFTQLDQCLPLDDLNPTEKEQQQLESQLHFKFPLYFSLVSDWIVTIHLFNSPQLHEMSVFRMVGLILSLGNLATSNINIAHELVHKNNIVDQVIYHMISYLIYIYVYSLYNIIIQLLGMSTLAKNLYMHFDIDHIKIHHKYVGTINDPATSRFGQNLYSFLWQSMSGNWIGCWQYEGRRLKDRSRLQQVIMNRMVWFSLNNIILPLIVYSIWGRLQLIIYLTSTFISIIYFETVNYIEHYGLVRKQLKSGVYEKVNITHSWNAPQRLTNYLLFKLQRHSDHHENGYKPYQTLCSFQSSPQMPQSYMIMILLAINPSTWFNVMNEYTLNYQKGNQITQQQVDIMNHKINRYVNKVTFYTSILCLLGYVI